MVKGEMFGVSQQGDFGKSPKKSKVLGDLKDWLEDEENMIGLEGDLGQKSKKYSIG